MENKTENKTKSMDITVSANKSNVNHKWFYIDAEGVPLGRVASKAAVILRGKHKPTYTPNVDTGDYVIIINSDKVVLTGNKLDQKMYKHYTLYPGGLKEEKYRSYLARKSDEAVIKAVKGMLPKSPLGRAQLKKLKVYKDSRHDHSAQEPVELKI